MNNGGKAFLHEFPAVAGEENPHFASAPGFHAQNTALHQPIHSGIDGLLRAGRRAADIPLQAAVA